MNRREATRLITTGAPAAAILALTGCESSSLTAPSTGLVPGSGGISLLLAIRKLGYSAERQAFGSQGAAQIAIDGDTRWNFYVDGNLVGIGSGPDATIDVAAWSVTSDAQISVKRF